MRWGPDEEKDLLTNLKEGLTLEEIAEKHGRTLTAIRSRVADLALKAYNAREDVAEICATYRFTEGELEELSALGSYRFWKARKEEGPVPQLTF